MKKPLNLAHRGFSGKYPENTMLAFKQAHVEGHCDGFFVGVHITADRQVVVINDTTLDRTTNGTGFIKDMTYEELHELDAGSKFDPKFGSEKIPLLLDVLNYAKEHNLFVNVELKNCEVYYDDIERLVIRNIHETKMKDHVTLSSVNHLSMEKCKAIDSDIVTGYTCGCPMLKLDEYLQHGRAKNLVTHYRILFYDRHLAQSLQDSEYLMYAWTVNDTENMLRMLELGVDAIITDYPDILHEFLSQLPEE